MIIIIIITIIIEIMIIIISTQYILTLKYNVKICAWRIKLDT